LHKILLIDDDEDLSEMVSLALTRYNMKVYSYTDCTNLSQKIIECNPDVILMDIYVGGDDGRKICFNHKNSVHQKIPVILYSAGNIISSSIKDSLANDFIQKPFNISQLVERINKQAV
jgi:DNA-binding response OmpR family regulator